MTCPICYTETEQHDKRWRAMTEAFAKLSELHDALAERVAKLEARIDGGLMVFGPTDKAVPLASGLVAAPPIDEGVERMVRQLANEAQGKRQTRPIVRAGEAIVPTGWKLAPGWEFGVAKSCSNPGGVGIRVPTHDATWGFFDPDLLPAIGACAAHAVEMGALVKDEPTAEAPKRCQHGVPSHLGCWNCTSYAVKIGDVVVDEPPATGEKTASPGEAHVCECSNGPCPACGGHGPSGDWSEGYEVTCDDCGVSLVVASCEPCMGRSTFEVVPDETVRDEPIP